MELTADLKTVKAAQKLEVDIEERNLDSLLYDFLSEMLYLKDAKYVIFKAVKVTIKEGKPNRLHAVFKGDTIKAA